MDGEIGMARIEYGLRDWDGKDGIWLEGLWCKECIVGGRAGM